MALAFAKYLKDQGRKVQYAYIQSGSLQESENYLEQGQSLAQQMGIPELPLELENSAKTYITKKLGSSLVSTWIVKTPFFRSLINMIPGFNYLIFLGKILDVLVNDPEMTIILDSPSSGHALTMFEATKNFQNIFKSGLLFDDTQKMLDKLYSEDFTKIHIFCLPTLMAVNEGVELKEQILNIMKLDTSIHCNNSFTSMPDLNHEGLPEFLQKKIDIEKQVIQEYSAQLDQMFGHSTASDQLDVIKDIVPSTKNLV